MATGGSYCADFPIGSQPIKSREIINARRRLKRHIDAIAKTDEQVYQALQLVGYPEPRLRAAGFETLLSIIVSQQVSTEAANSIWQRVCSAVPSLNAPAVADCEPERLRAAGMSGRKVEYAKGLADSILSGDFDPDALADMSDDQALEQIIALRGFGRWSAEIYLMFSLRRADIFAADDLALQIALQRLKGLADKPSAKHARELVAHWAPRRSAGSLFLWHYYRGAPA